MTDPMVKCGDCKHFVRNGNCRFLRSAEGRDPKRAFEHAPFWVWSDCYSDKEQVRANVTSACPTFAAKPIPAPPQRNEVAPASWIAAKKEIDEGWER